MRQKLLHDLFIGGNMKIIQLKNFSPTQMMGFLIVADDGTLIVIDGGNRADTEGFLNALEEFRGSRFATIDYWFMTHPHDDHYGVFAELTDRAATGARIPGCRNFCYCPQDNSLGMHEKHFAGQIVEFNEKAAATKYPVTHLKVRDKFVFGNLTVEVLRVPDPSITENAFNNSSCILKFTEKRGMKDDFVMIFLGDLGVEGGRQLLEVCPEGIKADAVQLAHHGQNGVGREVYEAIAPRFAFFCTPDWLWYNTIDPAKPGCGPWKTLEVRQWMRELGAVPVRACEKNVVFDTAWID